MQVDLQHIGKKYQRDWIFKNLTASFSAGTQTALLGNNGSGKSTLLKIISGYLTPTEGLVIWKRQQSHIGVNDIHAQLALCAPYQCPFLEFTLRENFDFYAALKPMQQQIQAKAFAELIELPACIDQGLHTFSSGMLQRVKLGLVLLSDVPLLLLDEPTSHLDKQAQHWYQQMLSEYGQSKTIFIATNESDKDAPNSTEYIQIRDFAT